MNDDMGFFTGGKAMEVMVACQWMGLKKLAHG
jgi:hypothetical protein